LRRWNALVPPIRRICAAVLMSVVVPGAHIVAAAPFVITVRAWDFRLLFPIWPLIATEVD
jgi:hypothetical protein